jgi:type II secretion system protein N
MLSKLNRKALLIGGAYALFFGFCFVLSAYYTFPYDRARDVIAARVAALPPAPGQQAAKLTIEELGPHWLTGIAAHGVQFERKGLTANDPTTKLAIDELTVRASLFGLLRKRADVKFGIEVGDGDANGSYAAAEGDPTHFDAELDELDLGKLGIGSYLGIPLAGSASGTIDLTVGDKPAETQGSIDMHITGVKLGDGKAKVKLPGMPGGLTIDAIDAGELELKVTIRDGVASIEKLESKGKDLALAGSGSVRVVKAVSQSRTDLTLGVKFDEGYTKKSERTKTVFELMGSNPLLKRATSADGTIRFRLTGPLGNLRAAPAPSARGRKGKAAGEDG